MMTNTNRTNSVRTNSLPETLSRCERDVLDALRHAKHPLTLGAVQTKTRAYAVEQLRVALGNLVDRGMVQRIAERYALVLSK